MENSKTKVIIIQKIFPSYRKDIFDAINKEYNLLLLHSSNNSDINQIKTNYSRLIRSLKYGRNDTNVYLFTVLRILKFWPKIIIHEFSLSIISIFTVLIISKIFKFKMVLWGHGYDKNKLFNEKHLNNRIRIWLIKKTDALILYGNTAKDTIKKFINPDKIFIAYNTINLNKLTNYRTTYEKEGIFRIKQELGISYDYNVLFFGRLLNEKILPDHFISIIISINKELKNIGFHLIGEGEAKKGLIEKCQKAGILNIHFYGPLWDDFLISKYFFVSDLLLNPGYVGLSVNYSLAFNKPVFTFKTGINGPFHSPEIENVQPNITGFLSNSMDDNDMSRMVVHYLRDKNAQTLIKKNILQYIEDHCSIDRMLNGFTNCISKLSKVE